MKQQWKLTLSYDGSHFHGWQVQPGLSTVQQTLSRAIREVTGETVSPQGSGRTDAGVHALAQVASFALESTIPEENFLLALNRMLTSSVRILSAKRVADGFHARKNAIAKTYEYRLFPRRLHAIARATPSERICSPFLAPFVWDCRWPVDFERMNDAAARVCGTYDFTSFAASDPERARRSGEGSLGDINPVRTIWQSAWHEEGDQLIYTVRGNGFLHHMVRNLVGTFVDIGRGALQPEAMSRILSMCNRSAAGATAPARGLFLKSVEYPEVLPSSGVEL